MTKLFNNRYAMTFLLCKVEKAECQWWHPRWEINRGAGGWGGLPPSKLHYRRPPTQMASGKLKRFASVITDASATESFLFSSRFLHLCGILRTVPAAMVIVLYSRSQQLLLEKLPQKRKWKPVLHCSQFWAGPQELILLCLIKLKWEFIFTEEATVKTGSVEFVALSEKQHFFFQCFFIVLYTLLTAESGSPCGTVSFTN